MRPNDMQGTCYAQSLSIGCNGEILVNRTSSKASSAMQHSATYLTMTLESQNVPYVHLVYCEDHVGCTARVGCIAWTGWPLVFLAAYPPFSRFWQAS